jgi:hypothetical protein
LVITSVVVPEIPLVTRPVTPPLSAWSTGDLLTAFCSHETAAMLTQALPHIPLLAVPREGSDEYVDQLDGLCAAVARYLVARYAEVEQP